MSFSYSFDSIIVVGQCVDYNELYLPINIYSKIRNEKSDLIIEWPANESRQQVTEIAIADDR